MPGWNRGVFVPDLSTRGKDEQGRERSTSGLLSRSECFDYWRLSIASVLVDIGLHVIGLSTGAHICMRRAWNMQLGEGLKWLISI